MKKYIKSKLNILVLIIITLIVLYLALKDDFYVTINKIITLNLFWFLMGVFLVLGYWFLRSIVFHYFVKEFKEDYRFSDAFRLFVTTQFFHAITPFASGGQPYEIYALKRQGLRLAAATNVSIQNFIVYQIALILLGIIAIVSNALFHIFREVGLLKELVLIGFLVNFGVIVGLFVVSFGKKINYFIIKHVITFLNKIKILKDREKALNRWQNLINDFYDGAKMLVNNKKLFLPTILINFVALLALYLVPLVILYGMGDFTSVDGFHSIISCAYVMLIGSFVPIPGGTGGLEYGYIQFFGNFVKGSILKASMLIWRFLTYYFGMIVGAIVLNIRRKDG